MTTPNLTVLRRLDAALEPTKRAVLDMKATLDAAGVTNQDAALARLERGHVPCRTTGCSRPIEPRRMSFGNLLTSD